MAMAGGQILEQSAARALRLERALTAHGQARVEAVLDAAHCVGLVQGQETDPEAVAEIRDAVRSGSEASVRLLNYKKSGKPFWNMFTLAPMADVDGNLRFIIGVQVKPSCMHEPPAFELPKFVGSAMWPYPGNKSAGSPCALPPACSMLTACRVPHPPQVDVTAAEPVAAGKIPQVDAQAAQQTKQTAGMINTALQHMGLGPDPWKSIAVGVKATKPHTAVRRLQNPDNDSGLVIPTAVVPVCWHARSWYQ